MSASGSEDRLVIASEPPAGYDATGTQPTAPAAATPTTTAAERTSGATTAAAAKKQPFYKRKWFIACQIVTAIVGIVLIFVLLFPVVRAIAQAIVNKSQLNVEKASILTPQNTTFQLHMEGYVSHTGIFNAKIAFREPISVAWVDQNGDQEVVRNLGTMELQPLYAKGSTKRAPLNQSTTFTITDEDAFGEFTIAMITRQNFTWRLTSNNLQVNALRFPAAKGLHFNKDVVLNGINNFDGKIVLEDFQLPSDAANGINFVAKTSLDNTSPFQVDLGTCVFALSYREVSLGEGTSTGLTLTAGNNSVDMSGVLVKHTNETELVVMGELFTQYLNSEISPVIAKGVSSRQSDGAAVSWLSAGLEALSLTVPFKPNAPINPIQSIDVPYMTLGFTPETAWQPSTSSYGVQAHMKLPFGFHVSIGQIENAFNISHSSNNIASLSTSLGQSTSDIKVLSSTDTEGIVNITIENTPLVVPNNDANHDLFSMFNLNLTQQTQSDFRLVGHARAVANMSIGSIVLNPIKFDVPSQLKGLGGLQNATKISSVDVLGGTNDAMTLAINVSIHNPSNLNLNTGNLTMQLYRGGGYMGTTLLPNLNLTMGDNIIQATAAFDPNASGEGKQTLDDFVGGTDADIIIKGFDSSTEVASLLGAFKTLSLGATLPGLTSRLLDSASLTILETTGITNNISHVTVSLANPFTAALQITSIASTVSSHGLTLGTIKSTDAFTSDGKATTNSPELDLDMDLDPAVIFSLLRALAVDQGMDTAQVDGIMEIGGIQLAQTYGRRNVHAKRNIYTNFNLPSYVDQAFANLTSNVTLSAGVKIGDYETTLNYTQGDLTTKTDESLNLLLPVLAQPIVQKIVTDSVLGIETLTISNPTETSFSVLLNGSITNAGPFDATIMFSDGLSIAWNNQTLGKMAMPNVSLVGDVGAALNIQEASFEIANSNALEKFTEVLLNEESFDWTISGGGLVVSALGINVENITISKLVTLKGMNGLQDGVVIESFDLPENDPAGGVHLTLNTSITNPSQVGIALDSIAFSNYYGLTYLGPVASESSFDLAPLSTTSLPLVGRLVPQNESSGLADVSTIFNNFIHGKDSNVTVYGASAGSADVTWLNQAIKTLEIQTSLPNQGVQKIITGVTLEEMSMMFTQDTAYAPATSSNATTASFTIPFNFPVDITAVAQNITAAYQGTDFAQLIIPQGPATTDVDTRIIHLTFSNIPFDVISGRDNVFQQFLAEVTMSANETFQLSGNADTEASTAVGTLSLTDISFSVDTTIAGLQGLDAEPALVRNLDVYHGYSDYLLITCATTLLNPSNLTIGTGDVSFGLLFNGQTVGSADIDGLVIVPGSANYSTGVHYSPQGESATAAGELMLENYIQGVISSTTIQGSTDTTNVDSLKLAMSEVKLQADIPALHQNLITAASLVFPKDIVKTGVADATFTIANPFTASINLLTVNASTFYDSLYIGGFDHVDISSSPISVPGHDNATSSTLPFDFDLDPLVIIQMLESAAQAGGVDLGPLTDLFQMVIDDPDYHPNVTATVADGDSGCSSGNQFDVDDAILNALSGLKVDLTVESGLKLDDFATQLSFNQSTVPAQTDETALYLIGVVAPPIVQKLVSAASISFNRAIISDISEDGFSLSLNGSLTGTGPLDALIEYVEPVAVNWQGSDIATLTLPKVCAAANAGVPNYQTDAQLAITDHDAFTEFATYMLHNEDFEWTISTNALRVTALGTVFDGVQLTKNVTLKAFDGLPGVTISNFQLPGDAPEGGISIETDSSIPSPAQLGVSLGTATFEAYYEGVLVGPLQASNLTLTPESTTSTHFSGRMIPQSGGDLDVVGQLFSNFLAGENQTLSVTGESVDPGSGIIEWLSTAFKTLTINVTLPGQRYEVIKAITIGDLEVVMTDDGEAYSPLSSSKSTVAQYANPFGFSLQVIESAEDIIISAGGGDVASLSVPGQQVSSGTSTGNDVDMVLSFTSVPMNSLSDSNFNAFFAGVTLQNGVAFELSGAANTTARTPIGDVPISGIPFNVSSSLAGINGFGGTASISNVTITGSGGNGGDEYVVSPLTTTINNPSNISLDTDDISLGVTYQGTYIGRAAIQTFNLTPGENAIASEFHYEPQDANDTTAQAFLESFLTTGDSLALSIKGDSDSTSFGSLVTALEGVSLSSSITGMNANPILTHVNVYISLSTLVTNLVEVDFDVHNPLDADLDISRVQADSGVNNEVYAFFNQPFDSFVIPPGGTVNSGKFGNVLLTKGALASLPIIPLGYLDVASAQTLTIAVGGYEVPWMKLWQPGTPTDYHLDILGLDFGDLESALSNNSSSNSIMSAASSAAGIVASATSAAGSAVSSVTSAAGSVFSSVTSSVGGAVSSAASAAESDASSFASAASSAVTSAASAAQSVGSAAQSGAASVASEVASDVMAKTASPATASSS
ncbi:uncharacterized protein C8Q71DRAFT_764402 [Rhodofomes roseus]|uniref:Autotransporter translocation and assembly factor TamB n=1 Tax=Rhodofomes roseus TaxID=34475 RepID=A0ABQ8KC49_9APHY|nr:uncharacterized protein C8Q71DRAFT_764402 [Rhodofomes roseus]KAH9835153.1 hypothetical protein C8Q71DRAFT_764402 [Rhodofomes roseus]